jgi:type I restriction enzyme S subunit
LVQERLDRRCQRPDVLGHDPPDDVAIDRGVYDGSNVPQINYGDIAYLPDPLPPLEEQVSMTEEVDARLTTLTYLEAELELEDTQAASLRQSILKAAFAGKLVPQDPNDEPARVLLARIRAERAARPGPARGRRRKAEAGQRQLELRVR